MNNSVSGIPRCLQGAALLAVFLLAAGCAAMLAPQGSPEGGRVDLSIGLAARTAAPRIDQFSKIELSLSARTSREP